MTHHRGLILPNALIPPAPLVGRTAATLPVFVWRRPLGCVVTCPVVPGARAEGATVELAIKAMEPTVKAWLDEHGLRDIPSPAECRLAGMNVEGPTDGNVAVRQLAQARRQRREELLARARAWADEEDASGSLDVARTLRELVAECERAG